MARPDRGMTAGQELALLELVPAFAAGLSLVVVESELPDEDAAPVPVSLLELFEDPVVAGSVSLAPDFCLAPFVSARESLR